MLGYPVLVYLGLQRLEPRWLALLLAGLATGRACMTRKPEWLLAAAGALVLAVIAAASNQALPLKLYPVLMNAVMLGLFAFSLWHPPTVVERLARLREPELPPAAILYTRRVTQVWCGFFIFNGSLAVATALWASDAVWALYNGLIAYLLMGILFAGEWLLRGRVRSRAAHG